MAKEIIKYRQRARLEKLLRKDYISRAGEITTKIKEETERQEQAFDDTVIAELEPIAEKLKAVAQEYREWFAKRGITNIQDTFRYDSDIYPNNYEMNRADTASIFRMRTEASSQIRESKEIKALKAEEERLKNNWNTVKKLLWAETNPDRFRTFVTTFHKIPDFHDRVDIEKLVEPDEPEEMVKPDFNLLGEETVDAVDAVLDE